MTTVILGAAVGYAPEQVAPFLSSLRKTGYEGDVALIVERAHMAAFRRHPLMAGVRLLPTSQWIPWRFAFLKENAHVRRWLWYPVQAVLWWAMRALRVLPVSPRRRLQLQGALGQHLYAPTESRFLRYLDFVLDNPCERILLTDVRDVLFQSDPFASLPISGLAISMEVPDYTVGTEKWNSSRVRLIFGDAVLRKVADRPVSCSGVTAGDRESMVRYLGLMARAILGLSRNASRQGWFDQAIHNVVIWEHWEGELHCLETFASPVATLGMTRETDIRRDPKGRILNRDASPVSILHQYDRLPSFKLDLLRSVGGQDS